VILRNRDGGFEKLFYEPSNYLGQRHVGRGLFKCDFDNDGDRDLGFCNLNEPFHLLRNECKPNRDWMGIRLIGVESDRSAVGAKAILKSGEESRTQFVVGGGSYLSHSDSRLLWSLPANTKSATLEIHWPSGRFETLQITDFQRYIDVVEATGK
jgi:hypothetical protein